ncbi:MAG: EamA family transporter, partial [Bacillota bacterium]
CYTTWNSAIRILGAVKTSVYIYGIPVVTVITSAIILRENITALAIAGTCCTLLGLFVSESKSLLSKSK